MKQNKFLKNEFGAPTVQSLIWIVVVISCLLTLSTIVRQKMSGALKNNISSMQSASFIAYCKEKGDGSEYLGGYVNEGLELGSDGTGTSGTRTPKYHTVGVSDIPDGYMDSLTYAQIATGLIRPACEFKDAANKYNNLGDHSDYGNSVPKVVDVEIDYVTYGLNFTVYFPNSLKSDNKARIVLNGPNGEATYYLSMIAGEGEHYTIHYDLHHGQNNESVTAYYYYNEVKHPMK